MSLCLKNKQIQHKTREYWLPETQSEGDDDVYCRGREKIEMAREKTIHSGDVTRSQSTHTYDPSMWMMCDFYLCVP